MSFFIYAGLFRLSIIAAGVGCVVMGYRLFVMGVMPKNGSEIDANAGEIRLSLKNAAPGTCFAVLGVLAIALMIVQGNPELKMVQIQNKDRNQIELTWRSDSQDIYAAMNSGKAHEAAGRLGEAIRAYAKPFDGGRLSLLEAATPLRAISGVFLTQQRLDEAIAYARLAIQVDPENAGGLALIARIQSQRGKHQEAFEAISKAARIDSAFVEERDRMLERRP